MIRPFFFGPEGHELFAIHHPPANAAGSAASRAVLICPPGPQEYFTTHWMLRRLATQLSAAGLHVLRFDYFGTGDSAGSSVDGTLEAWQSDIAGAAATLCKLAGTERVSAVGLRLGATLAWMATLNQAFRVRDLLLWEPVINGDSYLDELVANEFTQLSGQLAYAKPASPPTEVFGVPLTPIQRRETQGIQLLSLAPPKATRTHLFSAQPGLAVGELRNALQAQAKRFTFHQLAESTEPGNAQVNSHQVLRAITSTLASATQ